MFQFQDENICLDSRWTKIAQCLCVFNQDSTVSSCPEYDIKPSDDEASALEIWGMWSTPSLL